MRKRIISLLLTILLLITSVSIPKTDVKVEAATLPKSYSSVDKGYITPIRDQGKYGTCWSFALIAGVEASLVRKGYADTSLDLSELAAAYYLFHTVSDPLHQTDGDRVEAVHGSWLDEGGNSDWGVMLFAKGQGLVYEKDAK